jgi:asparagine synthetase B (glutamine-hydrolysing)
MPVFIPDLSKTAARYWHPSSKVETDAAEKTDRADRALRRALSSRKHKAIAFCLCRGGLNAPGAIRLIRGFRRIRFNL